MPRTEPLSIRACTACRVAESILPAVPVAVDQLDSSVADVEQLLQEHPGSVSRWLETLRGVSNRSELVSRILTLTTELDPTAEAF